MFRQLCHSPRITLLKVLSVRWSSNFVVLPPSISALNTAKDSEAAQTWVSQFKTRPIPRDAVELSFSRSSGPGGQNVNKVNSKATVRCPIDSRWIPHWARPELVRSSHYAASSGSLLISSTVHRSQVLNVGDCLSKLHALVLAAAIAPIKKEPSERQKKHVASLEFAEKNRNRRSKTIRAEVKRGRASGRQRGVD